MLEVRSLTHRFGPRLALDDVGFDVDAGEIVGLVGPNGAGKTTAMRALLGVIEPDAGTVRWNGATVGLAQRRRFGYLPEERGLYPKMPAGEQLAFLAELKGAGAAAAREAAGHWLHRLGLGERAADPVETMSLGNQQRVQLAAALVHGPAVLVLDEPFSGLDPPAVDELAAVLREQSAVGELAGGALAELFRTSVRASCG
jgi:ABC-2 type transport system ATP-binding protein